MITIDEDARTSGDEVRGALGVTDDEDLPTSVLVGPINRAHRLVERKCAPYTADEAALGDVETLVAADFAAGLLSGAGQGTNASNVESISEMDVTIDFDTSSAQNTRGDDGHTEHWRMAVRLDPTGRLNQPEGNWPYSTG